MKQLLLSLALAAVATAATTHLNTTGANWPAGDKATFRANAGLAIGTNVQAWDADLTTWAGITPATYINSFLSNPTGANLALALTTPLPATDGGTGLTALGSGVATALGNNANQSGGVVLYSGALGIPLSGNFSAGSFTWPTFNQNTTGSAASVPASGITGTTLPAGITASSLMSVGNLSGLTIASTTAQFYLDPSGSTNNTIIADSAGGFYGWDHFDGSVWRQPLRFTQGASMAAAFGGYVTVKNGIDIQSGQASPGSIRVGADVNALTRSSNTRKFASFTAPDFTNTKAVEFFNYDSPTSTVNILNVGGRASGSQYGITSLNFVTAPDTATTGGTARMTIDGNGQTKLLNQTAGASEDVMTRGLSDNRYGEVVFAQLASDSTVSSTTEINSALSVTLTAGKWKIETYLDMSTVSTTGGAQATLYTLNAGDSFKGGLLESRAANSSTITNRYLSGSGSGQTIFTILTDAPGTIAYGSGSTVLSVATAGTFFVKIKQRSATDGANPAILKSSSWIEARRVGN